MEDDVQTESCILGQLDGAALQPPPQSLAAQREAQERAAKQHDEWMAREALERQASQDASVRQSALHGALMLDYASKEVEAVLSAARQIESFLRGETAQPHQH